MQVWLFVLILGIIIGIRVGGRMMANTLGKAEARGILRKARGTSRIRWW